MKFVIIGAGIIGSAVALEFASRGLGEVIVLEKEARLGEHASGRNSGVLHSGINQKPGSLKARMCVEGNRLARRFCLEHGVRMQECGTLVVARNEREEKALGLLLDLGVQAGVQGLRIIDRDELNSREPEVAGTRALLSPNGAVVDSNGFLEAVAAKARDLGAVFRLGAGVRQISGLRVITDREEFEAGHVINCAGLHADTIARMMGAGGRYRIIPFRGEYMALKKIRLNSMVYQVPDLRYPFLGVHLTRTVDGEVLAGPTAMLSFGRESYDKQVDLPETLRMTGSLNFWLLALSPEFLRLAVHNARISFSRKAFLQEVRTLWPGAAAEDLAPYRSGIRAQMVDTRGRLVDDMLVEFRQDSTHVLNAVSPGLTSSLAFARYLADRIAG
ncbi:MAG: L-2-hydroxyglutarate oxidase [Candidatus Glassbacteria bacterium]|nr:L-2-hydroxyglutarate oxidase [Candidatus Glassbacteria bacterium]